MNDRAAITKRSMEDESILGIGTQEETPTEPKPSETLLASNPKHEMNFETGLFPSSNGK